MTGGDTPMSGLITRKMARVWNYGLTLRFLGAAYCLIAALFLFFPNEVIAVINALPKTSPRFGLPLPPLAERFWQVLGAALMATQAALCFLAASAPYVRGYALTHLVSKAVSAVTFWSLFLGEQRYFAYLLGGGIDFAIFVSAGWSLIRLGFSPDPTAIPAGTSFPRTGALR